MANNSNTNCSDIDWYEQAGGKAFIVAYYFLTPVYFSTGFFGRLLYLAAFYAQSKKEQAYIYQIFLTASETVEVVYATSYIVTFQCLASSISPLTEWFRSCYFCMWSTGHLIMPGQEMAITMSEIFTVCMCCDRLLALWKPTKYESVSTGRTQAIIAVSCISISILSTLHQCWVIYPKQSGLTALNSTLYTLEIDGDFDSSILNESLNNTRSAFRFIGLLILYICSFGLIHFLRLRTKNAANLGSETEKKRRKSERTLILLIIGQSICITVKTSFLATFYNILTTMFPELYNCKGALIIPISDGLVMLIDLIDFIVVFTLSKPLRKAVYQMIPCCKNSVGVTVSPVKPIPAL